ncbi:MAG: FliH/SctL family protein [Peptococcales bacterium]
MSKIIKANHLILVPAESDNRKNCSTNIGLTSDNIQAFYEEAKIMVEELITDAKVKAENILENAELKANEIINKAQVSAENIKNEAFQEGFLKGEEAGLLAVKELQEKANAIVLKAHQERREIIKGLESEIVDFSLEIAKKVIRNEIKSKPEVIQFIVKELLTLVQDSTRVTVKVCTSDYERLEEQKAILQAVLSYGLLNLENDPTLSQGDCIVISDTGILVAKIDKQLDKLQDVLQEVAQGD